MAVFVRHWDRGLATTVFCDCAGIVRRALHGHGIGGMQSERRAIWSLIWRTVPDVIHKVQAHRTWAAVRDDPWQRLLWRGNGIADRFAKVGACKHPGGERQLR
eukprot:4652625-Amphidinium_carterae.1